MTLDIFKKYETILFDLDGTLIDSARGLSDTLNYVLEKENIPPLPLEIARPYTGVGSRKLLEVAFEYHNLTLNKERLEALRTNFLTDYALFFKEGVSPFAGAEKLLKSLEKDKKNIILATNKPRRYTLPTLEILGWKDYFLAIACGDDTHRPKPHPHHLEYALERAGGLSHKTALMVGDASTDYLSAIGANIDVAIVLFYESKKHNFPDATYFIESFL